MAKQQNNRLVWTERLIDAYNAEKNVSKAARRLGIDRQTMKDSLQEIKNTGIISSTPEKKIVEYLYRSHDAIPVYETQGKDFYIQDFEYLKGQELVGIPTNEEGQRFQVIIKGRSKEEGERKFTTTLFGDMEDALDAAGEMMDSYEDSAASVIIIRVFTPGEFEQ